MVLGALLVLAGASLFLYNQNEADKADRAAVQVMPEVISAIEEQHAADAVTEAPLWTEMVDVTMTEVEIDGYLYIGYVSIPALELELPVMSDWSYPQLQISPCRYSGAVGSDDLVLLAHNYQKHFGRISELHEGDSVIFTDMDGKVTYYEVIAVDVLEATAVEDMVAGEFDLTLFTCTYGGQSRVTLRCDRVTD